MTQPQPQPMPSARRRIPGMTSQGRAQASRAPVEAPAAPTAVAAPEVVASGAGSVTEPAPASASSPAPRPVASPSAPRSRSRASQKPASEARRLERGRARDYATTRLVNFRIPVDLHDRFKRILRDVEDEHPRLRHPNLTELLIGLLEEGPKSADEVAGVIRRKRAAEHSGEDV